MSRLILEVIDNANTICLSSLNLRSFSFKSLKICVDLRFPPKINLFDYCFCHFWTGSLAINPKVDYELSLVKRVSPVGEPAATKESIGSGDMRFKCMHRHAHRK